MEQFQIIDVMKTADMLVRTCVGVKAGEEVLIVTDNDSSLIVAHALAAAARILGAEPTISVMPPLAREGAYPPPIVSKAIDGAQVVFDPASTSVVLSPAAQAGLRGKRLRYITMPAVDAEMMTKGAATADYAALYERTKRLAVILSAAKTIRVTSDLGTDLTASIAGMPSLVAAAYAQNPGDVACFPDGEVPQAPVEGTAEGVVVIDTSMHMLGLLKEPIRWVVEKGRVVSIEGGAQAAQLREIVRDVKNGDVLGEIAVGTNPLARVTGNVSEDKKGAGRVHMALGSNVGLGGQLRSQVHIDGVILEPTVEVDGKVIVEKGKLVIDLDRPRGFVGRVSGLEGDGSRVLRDGELHMAMPVLSRGEDRTRSVQRKLITAEFVSTVPGECALRIPSDALITPAARDLASECGIHILSQADGEVEIICNHDMTPQ